MDMQAKRKIEEFPKGILFLYMQSDGIAIKRSALHEMILDMNRNYETAGLLLGNYSKNVVHFDAYVPSKALDTRSYSSVVSNIEKQKKELAYYSSKGYHSVALVHSHPQMKIAHLLREESLNFFDRRHANELSKPIGEQLKFEKVYEGVLSISPNASMEKLHNRININAGESHFNAFSLSIFDAFDGAEESLGFNLEGEIEKESSVKSLLRKARIARQTIKLKCDSLFMNSVLVFSNALRNVPANEDGAKRIREVLNEIEIPKKLKGRIGIEFIDGQYLLLVSNPPFIIMAFHRSYYAQLDRLLKDIQRKADALFPYYIDNL